MVELVTLVLLLTITGVVVAEGESAAGAKTECYANPNGDKMDPNNIYTCVSPQTCCQENAVPTCCATKETSEAVVGQAQLWGTLAGLIIVVALLMWYCRHDGDCCGNTKGKIGCCCCTRDEVPDNANTDIEKVKLPPEPEKLPAAPVNKDLVDIESDVVP
ncbi:uncharacterized protein [Cherax quadricarinatus]|uniref:uncharacterized protein n=1 Tax=Cherax quadricarinatus TaxID=27406 RepID=UPI00387E3352